jgi:hypothetical protein
VDDKVKLLVCLWHFPAMSPLEHGWAESFRREFLLPQRLCVKRTGKAAGPSSLLGELGVQDIGGQLFERTFGNIPLAPPPNAVRFAR